MMCSAVYVDRTNDFLEGKIAGVKEGTRRTDVV